jgi:hypothetical protein
MPTQGSQPFSDAEIDKLLKEREQRTAAPPPAATPDAGMASALEQFHNTVTGGGEPRRAPTYDEMDWQQAAGQGAAREATRLGMDAMRYITPGGAAIANLTPQSAKDWIRGHVPGVQRLEDFANAEPEGPAEYLGSGAVDVALGGLIPELGLSRLASRAAPLFRRGVQQVPTWINPLGAGGKWVMGHMPTINYAPRSHAAAQLAARTADTAAKGALGGELTDPDDPVEGAEYGAAAALSGRAAGKALKSKTAQQVGGWVARHAPTAALGGVAGELFGHQYGMPGVGAGIGGAMGSLIPHAVGGVTRHYHTIPGRGLQRFGQATFDSAGRFIGYTAPATAGMEAGKIARGDRPTITIPRRADPEASPPSMWDSLNARPQETDQ